MQQPVEVLDDGAWYPSTLTRWSHDARGWGAVVSWTVAPGMTYRQWVPAARLRPVQGFEA